MKAICQKNNTAVMVTTYYESDGTITEAIGYVAGMVAIPVDGYKVDVKNKAKNNEWNLPKCTIK